MMKWFRRYNRHMMAGLVVFLMVSFLIQDSLTRQSDKRQVQAMVRLLLDLAADPEPFDAADALAIALTHLSHRKATQMAGGGLAAVADRAVLDPRGRRAALPG